jgi:quaternary ammonium compound-resistance protein SugE
MNWFYLLLAGLFEIGWIISLKYTSGFTRLLPMLSYAVTGLGAAYFLSLALRSMPLGLTYAIWVGIGIAGSNILSVVLFKEPYQFMRIFFILMILCGVVGLKFYSIR